MEVRKALQLYSIRARLEEDFEGAVRQIADQGYEGVELAGTYGFSAAELRGMFLKYRLIPVSAHVGMDEFLKGIAETVSFYHEIGCSFVVIPGLEEKFNYGGAEYGRLFELITEIAAECGKYGMKLLYHNHDMEFVKTETGIYELDALFENGPELGMELDTCWADAAGVDAAAYLKKYGNRCPLVHVKDYRRNPDQTVCLEPLGQGAMDLPKVMRAAKTIGVQWFIVEQDDHYGEDEFLNTKISVEYLKESLKKMEKIRVGIVGCGGIANGKHLPAMKRNGNFEITAFCDLIAERAKKAKEEYGTKDAKVFGDYTELLKEDLDAVYVLTPNKSHAMISIAAMKAGKHVMCEKPMAKTYEEAKEMVRVSEETGKILNIGYQNRFRPDSQYLKKACENGDLGEVYYAKAHAVRRRAVPTWGVFLNEEEQGGGPLIDIGTHALDLTLWMMDNYEPESVTGSVYRKLADQTDQGNAFGAWDPKEYTVEDSAFGFIKMKNGVTIHLESSWALNTLDVGEAQTSLCGTKAGADMGKGLRINRVNFDRQCVETPDLETGGVAFFEGKAENESDREQKVFYNAVAKGEPQTVKPRQAMVVTQLLEAIYESARTGKTVYFE